MASRDSAKPQLTTRLATVRGGEDSRPSLAPDEPRVTTLQHAAATTPRIRALCVNLVRDGSCRCITVVRGEAEGGSDDAGSSGGCQGDGSNGTMNSHDALAASLARSSTQTAAIDHAAGGKPSVGVGIDTLGPPPPSSGVAERVAWIVARRAERDEFEPQQPGVELAPGR